jgi:hypothetical protein
MTELECEHEWIITGVYLDSPPCITFGCKKCGAPYTGVGIPNYATQSDSH